MLIVSIRKQSEKGSIALNGREPFATRADKIDSAKKS